MELKSDIRESTRKIWLTEFFYSKNLDSSQEIRESVFDRLVKNKSVFYPHCNRNKFLDTTINLINLNNFSIYKTNLNQENWQVFKEVTNDKIIVIKEAKGGAVVMYSVQRNLVKNMKTLF